MRYIQRLEFTQTYLIGPCHTIIGHIVIIVTIQTLAVILIRVTVTVASLATVSVIIAVRVIGVKLFTLVLRFHESSNEGSRPSHRSIIISFRVTGAVIPT